MGIWTSGAAVAAEKTATKPKNAANTLWSELAFVEKLQGDFKRVSKVQVSIKPLFIEAQRLSFWIYEIQRYTIFYI